VPSLPRGNGHFRLEFQALCLRLPGTLPFAFPIVDVFSRDLPKICSFCWHHIKENLNKRCPACRRIYTDDAVEFKPIATQEYVHCSLLHENLFLWLVLCSSHKRLTQQKKQRERERKELETLGRRHLANVRVVQRNVVYVVGIGPRFAKEEVRRYFPGRSSMH